MDLPENHLSGSPIPWPFIYVGHLTAGFDTTLGLLWFSTQGRKDAVARTCHIYL